MQIKDRVAIVTGASSGIGMALAKQLSQKGAKVVLVARSQDKLEQIASKLPNSFVIPTDMRKKLDIETMVKKAKTHFGRIDLLINNAGRGYHVPIMQIESEKYRALFDLDVLGPLIAMQQVIPIMKQQGGGMIVNISSGTSLMHIPGIAAYSSLKRALNAISLTARAEFKADNIIVSVVYPYITKTNFHKNLINRGEWQMEESEDRPPFDTPEYIAEKIVVGIKKNETEIYAHDWMKQS